MNAALIDRLYQTRDRIEHDIRWTKYALEAPEHFVTPALQKIRFDRLANMLKELETLQKLISDHEFHVHEQQVLQQRAETKAALQAMGVRFTSDKGTFYLLF